MVTFIKKISLGLAVVVGLFGYMTWSSTQMVAATSVIATTNSGTSPASQSSAGASGSNNTPTNTTSSGSTVASNASTGMYRDGTYTGSAASTIYGDVQVKATVVNGNLTKITFLSYPSDQGHSAQVSQNAMPILSSEAITSQSANVDAVSGATQISAAFQQSLQSALSQAQA